MTRLWWWRACRYRRAVTLIYAGWLPQGRTVRLEWLRWSNNERDPNAQLRITHRSLAGHSQALPSPPRRAIRTLVGASEGFLGPGPVGSSPRRRARMESPQRSEENRPCRPTSDDQDLAPRGMLLAPPLTRRGRPVTSTSRRVPERSRCWPRPAACAAARSRSTGRAGAGYHADRGHGPPGRPCPIAAAEPPRDDTADGVARRPRSAAGARARCRSW